MSNVSYEQVEQLALHAGKELARTREALRAEVGSLRAEVEIWRNETNALRAEVEALRGERAAKPLRAVPAGKKEAA